MSNIIAVWGSPGSGKSMLCCILAKYLTQYKDHKAIIISGDQMTPMLPVWMPDQIIETSASVGNVLTSHRIDTAITASHVTVLRSFPFIGLMGYAAKENPLSYPEAPYEKYRELIGSASRLVDYVILDCPSNLTCLFTPAAIEIADDVICMVTPDPKGMSYLQAQRPLLVDPKFQFDQHIMIAGMARPYQAIDEMDHIIGGFAGLWPFVKEIDRAATQGEMFEALQYCGKKHQASLSHLAAVISGDAVTEEKTHHKRELAGFKVFGSRNRRRRTKPQQTAQEGEPENDE